jgi:hypothetical protein
VFSGKQSGQAEFNDFRFAKNYGIDSRLQVISDFVL